MNGTVVAELSLKNPFVPGKRWALWRLYSDGATRSWHWNTYSEKIHIYVHHPAGSPEAIDVARLVRGH